MKVFVDTSYLYALYCTTDACHTRAKEIAIALPDTLPEFYIGSHILMELATLLRMRVSKQLAVKATNQLFEKPFVMIYPDGNTNRQAASLFATIPSKNVSYADCLSFTIMKQRDIHHALTFDSHFTKQGFVRVGIDEI